MAPVKKTQALDPRVRDYSTVTLLNRLVAAVRKTSDRETIYYGCIVCGDSTRLTTHVIPGYGDACAEHAKPEPRAKPYPWAAEGAELDRRGVRGPEQ